MNQVFEFNDTRVYSNTLDIDDVFCTNIEARDDKGSFYYLNIFSESGHVTITEFGPIIEKDMLPSGFKVTHTKMECKANSVIKLITKFLGNKPENKSKIVTAKEITVEELRERFPNIIDFIK